jgi:hypothetical protein
LNKEDIKTFLSFLSAQNVNSFGKWVKCSCPLAPWTHDSGKDNNPSFAIQVNEHGESIYNCYTCGYGDMMELVHRLSEFGAQSPKYKLAEAAQLAAQELDGEVHLDIKDWGEEEESYKMTPWPESTIVQLPRAVDVPVAWSYLSSRGVSDDMQEILDIRFDLNKMTVVFPVRDFTHTLMGLRGRYINPKPGKPKYHAYKIHEHYENNLIWYGEHLLDPDAPVLMVESVFDYARARQFFPNVIAPLTVGISRAKAERLSMLWQITTLFDHGKGGDRARDLVDKYWKDAVIEHWVPPHDEPGLDGSPASDPGNMTDDQLRYFYEHFD